eukprot:9779920-Alexandrium_andersonii.AAC.1
MLWRRPRFVRRGAAVAGRLAPRPPRVDCSVEPYMGAFWLSRATTWGTPTRLLGLLGSARTRGARSWCPC